MPFPEAINYSKSQTSKNQNMNIVVQSQKVRDPNRVKRIQNNPENVDVKIQS